MMLVDAFAPVQYWKRTQNWQDRISGWSLGGTVALYFMVPIIDVLGTPFDAHLPFYPAAHLRPDIQNGPMHRS